MKDQSRERLRELSAELEEWRKSDRATFGVCPLCQADPEHCCGAKLQAQLSQAQAEIALLKAVVAAADRMKPWVALSEHGMKALDVFDAARAKLKATSDSH